MVSLKDYKRKQLEILHELDRVCDLADVKYYLAYGSCLGAVRHHGFIPWDDDIDVFLPVKEMEKLLQNRHLFKEQYFLQCRETEPNYRSMKCSLRDSSTTLFSDEKDRDDINHGMLIDLYVLYPYPDHFFHAHKLIIDSFILRFLYMGHEPRNHGAFGKMGYKLITALYGGERAKKKIRKIENDLKHNDGSRYYASFFGDDITPFSCFKFPMKYFDKPKMLQFEDYMAPCPSEPEDMCRRTYGDDFMEFPPEEKRKLQHDIMFVSIDRPYTDFKGKYY